MSKRSPEEDVWSALNEDPSDAELDAEMDRIEKMSPEEVERELQAAGFDLEKVQADSRALHERIAQAPRVAHAQPVPVEPAPRWVRRTRVALLLAAAFAGVVAVASVVVHREDTTVAVPAPSVAPSPKVPRPPSPEDVRYAADLRNVAKRMCDDESWDICLGDLDQAAKLDPSGDGDAVVQRLRAEAKEGLARPPRPRPEPTGPEKPPMPEKPPRPSKP